MTAFVVAVAAVLLWPTNDRRFERVLKEPIVSVAPAGQSIEDAISSSERPGENNTLPFTDRSSHASRNYRLPDGTDKRTVILDYGRALLDEGWKDIVISCDGNSLTVSGYKEARVRLVDPFTMRATARVDEGVFLQDSGDPEPTLRPGGLGVGVLVSAPPVRPGLNTPVYEIKNKPPAVVTDERCNVDSITGDEADRLLD